MKNDLLFDFTVDKTTNSAFVNREFSAGLSLVWDAFTVPEILDQWWAPKPWLSKTRYMNFTEGGRRVYAMCSPEGQEHWSIQDFSDISAKTNFRMHCSFADKDENINAEMPASDWSLDFTEADGITTVKIVIKHDTLASLEQIIAMGFQGGFTMTLSELDQLLNKMSADKPEGKG